MTPELTKQARNSLISGDRFPFDASDEWLDSETETSPPRAKDYAHRAARGIIANLRDRRSIKNGFNMVDEEVRVLIVETIAAIIREANPDLARPGSESRDLAHPDSAEHA
jgi:hypothetical protein